MYVFDIEADGLYDSVTKVHCIVLQSVNDPKDLHVFRPDQIRDALAFMAKQSILIGHNVINYDFPVLEKLYGFKFQGTVVDTLVMSRVLYPNRTIPPKLIQDTKEALISGQKVKLPGPHSVASWGYTLGKGKVHHEDWSTFSEAMLVRCVVDVDIQRDLFLYLRKRMDTVQFPKPVMSKTFKVFDILSQMERYGWLFDSNKALRLCSLLTHWMNRIERLLAHRMPMLSVCLESKKDGEVNYVRKPFMKSGLYSAITLRTYPELQGKGVRDGFVSGPFSRVEFRRVDISKRSEIVPYLLSVGWVPMEWNYKTDEDGRTMLDHNGEPIKSSPKLNYKDPFYGVQGVTGQLVTKYFQCQHRLSLIQGLLQLVDSRGRISQRISGMATTGRLTHNGIVNIPGDKSFLGHKIRELFICKPGYVLVGTDSVSCQDRALANRANDPAFTEMLLNGDKSKGTDGHSLNQKAINKVLEPLGISISRDDAKNHGYGLTLAHIKLGELLER